MGEPRQPLPSGGRIRATPTPGVPGGASRGWHARWETRPAAPDRSAWVGRRGANTPHVHPTNARGRVGTTVTPTTLAGHPNKPHGGGSKGQSGIANGLGPGRASLGHGARDLRRGDPNLGTLCTIGRAADEAARRAHGTGRGQGSHDGAEGRSKSAVRPGWGQVGAAEVHPTTRPGHPGASHPGGSEGPSGVANGGGGVRDARADRPTAGTRIPGGPAARKGQRGSTRCRPRWGQGVHPMVPVLSTCTARPQIRTGPGPAHGHAPQRPPYTTPPWHPGKSHPEVSNGPSGIASGRGPGRASRGEGARDSHRRDPNPRPPHR
ncbi:hypothetical protein COCNU_scaffold051126G000020 [Cocos nucifera]|nr:hypothetical protein [Cocos nucifera]